MSLPLWLSESSRTPKISPARGPEARNCHSASGRRGSATLIASHAPLEAATTIGEVAVACAKSAGLAALLGAIDEEAREVVRPADEDGDEERRDEHHADHAERDPENEDDVEDVHA